MRKGDYLGNFELMLLLALIRLGDNAYGVTIASELEEKTGHEVILANVYAKLERLEKMGYAGSKLGDPTPERGGKAKRYFHVTSKGVRKVQETQRSLIKLWHGLPQLRGGTA
jgi:PadR family transcriptional regulator PadR